MGELFSRLEQGGVGIFESPTGTGKSLSLLCGVLHWLIEQEQKDEEAVAAASAASPTDPDEPAWITEQAHAAAVELAREALPSREEARRRRAQRLAAYEAGVRKRRMTQSVAASRRGDPMMPGAADVDGVADDEEEEDFSVGAVTSSAIAGDLLESEDEDEPKPRRRQIFYCSRTHSQLAQVVGEVKKTGYADQISVVSLASRRALCINEDLRTRARGADGLTEACLDLQQGARKARTEDRRVGSGRDGRTTQTAESHGVRGCPYFQPGATEHREAQQALSDRMLQARLP